MFEYSILENLRKIVFFKITFFCDFHNIISSSQFGFRKGLSTLHAIETLQKAIIDSLISNKYCVGLFIDLKKAFDTVNHEILLKKLDFYGIRELPLSWLSSYLKDRSQFTNYNNCMSNTTNIDIGFPQGSIIGPLFFLIYINDMPTCSINNTCILFADDTNIIISNCSANKLKVKLQLTINEIMLWVK